MNCLENSRKGSQSVLSTFASNLSIFWCNSLTWQHSNLSLANSSSDFLLFPDHPKVTTSYLEYSHSPLLPSGHQTCAMVCVPKSHMLEASSPIYHYWDVVGPLINLRVNQIMWLNPHEGNYTVSERVDLLPQEQIVINWVWLPWLALLLPLTMWALPHAPACPSAMHRAEQGSHEKLCRCWCHACRPSELWAQPLSFLHNLSILRYCVTATVKKTKTPGKEDIPYFYISGF